MSKKNNKQVDNNKKIVTEEKSKAEIIFTRVIVTLGIIAILVIILVNIPYQGEKGKIADKYTSLTADNVFAYVEYDELKTKIEKGDEFELLLINTRLEDANYFIYCVNYIVQSYQKEEKNICDEILIFDTYDLETEQEKYFKTIEKTILNQPALVHFKKTISSHSFDDSCSMRSYNLEDYGNNNYYLLLEYFNDNYPQDNMEDNN